MALTTLLLLFQLNTANASTEYTDSGDGSETVYLESVWIFDDDTAEELGPPPSDDLPEITTEDPLPDPPADLEPFWPLPPVTVRLF